MDKTIKLLEAVRKVSEQRAQEFQAKIQAMADEPGIQEPQRAARYCQYANLRDKWIQAAYKATELIQEMEWRKKYYEWYVK